jgi:transposase
VVLEATSNAWLLYDQLEPLVGSVTVAHPLAVKLLVQQDLSLLRSLEELVGAVEAELGRLSTCEPWVKQVPFLVQLLGLGVLSVMSLLGAIGDITRFPSAKKFVGYAGLGASVHDSGETQEARPYYQRGPT